eukprot:GEMP01065440.1.p2 GENE.GEMP01065440.1~~GEMP01065440.1.p2  ORF type:complete len:112 (-),score=2.77 GEMP01065440.1:791-1126(-)
MKKSRLNGGGGRKEKKKHIVFYEQSSLFFFSVCGYSVNLYIQLYISHTPTIATATGRHISCSNISQIFNSSLFPARGSICMYHTRRHCAVFLCFCLFDNRPPRACNFLLFL